MKYTLGLDCSPLRIGWALTDDDLNPIKHGVIIFPPKEWVTPAMRAEAMEDALEDEKIKHVGAEAVFVGMNKLGSIRAAMALGQLESICDFMWPEADQKILTATQWRKLCGIRQGGKVPVMEWATRFCAIYGATPPDNQDAADAIAISYATVLWHEEQAGE